MICCEKPWDPSLLGQKLLRHSHFKELWLDYLRSRLQFWITQLFLVGNIHLIVIYLEEKFEIENPFNWLVTHRIEFISVGVKSRFVWTFRQTEKQSSLRVWMGYTGFWNVNCQQQKLLLGYQIRFHPGSGWNVQCPALTCFTSCIVLSEVKIIEVRKRNKRGFKASVHVFVYRTFRFYRPKPFKFGLPVFWGND